MYNYDSFAIIKDKKEIELLKTGLQFIKDSLENSKTEQCDNTAQTLDLLKQKTTYYSSYPFYEDDFNILKNIYYTLKNSNPKIEIYEIVESLKKNYSEYSSNPLYFDYCIIKCYDLWNIFNISSLFPQDSEILNRLISTNDFKLHLAISALYTVKYLKSDTYMKAATYIFYGPDFESESCSTESKDTYNILKPNNKLATDNQYNAKIKDRINDSQKTHQRLFYEITEISNPHGKSYYLRLFLPTLAYIFERNTAEEKTRKPKIKYLELPNIDENIDENNNDFSYRYLNNLISDALKDMNSDYNYLVKKFLESKSSNNYIERVLFFYKLERVFPVEFLTSVFLSNLKSFSPDTIIELGKFPDIKTRCNIIHQNIPFTNNSSSIKSIINAISLLEKYFFLFLVNQYNEDYEKLEANLTDYIQKKKHNIFLSEPSEIYNNGSTLNLCTMYNNFIDNNDLPKKHYYSDDDYYAMYDYLTIPNTFLPIDIQEKFSIMSRYQFSVYLIKIIKELFAD